MKYESYNPDEWNRGIKHFTDFAGKVFRECNTLYFGSISSSFVFTAAAQQHKFSIAPQPFATNGDSEFTASDNATPLPSSLNEFQASLSSVLPTSPSIGTLTLGTQELATLSGTQQTSETELVSQISESTFPNGEVSRDVTESITQFSSATELSSAADFPDPDDSSHTDGSQEEGNHPTVSSLSSHPPPPSSPTPPPSSPTPSPPSPATSATPRYTTRSSGPTPVSKTLLTVFHYDGGNYIAKALDEFKGQELVDVFRRWNGVFQIVNKVSFC